MLTETFARQFASLALAHVSREYPNKLDHVLLGHDDVRGPQALHPIFFGSFDWHSCVHGYWLRARVYRRYPDIPDAARIRTLFDEQLTSSNVAIEAAYAGHPSRAGFERPYGWAWMLMLAAELGRHDTHEGKQWAAALDPLTQVFMRRFLVFLPMATYPVRVGTHFNTAFAITLAWEYARRSVNPTFMNALREAAVRWYACDTRCQAWEPGGDDFLSSALIEAECMRRVLPPAVFSEWMDAFLPDIANGEPVSLVTPALVSDRTDGKIAHLDGLNLSRAWCWRMLSSAWSSGDPRHAVATRAVTQHLEAGLSHVAGDYMGEHWLATFALLALDDSTV